MVGCVLWEGMRNFRRIGTALLRINLGFLTCVIRVRRSVLRLWIARARVTWLVLLFVRWVVILVRLVVRLSVIGTLSLVAMSFVVFGRRLWIGLNVLNCVRWLRIAG